MTSMRSTPGRFVWSCCLGPCASLVVCVVVRAQVTKPPVKEPGPVVVRPTASTPSSSGAAEKKQREWIGRIQAAERDLERGQRAKARAVFEELLKDDRDNPIAVEHLVRLLIDEGRWREARDLLGSSSRSQAPRRAPVPLEGWQVLAPFPFRDQASFKAALEPEANTEQPDLKASYKGDGRLCRWKRHSGPRVDFREALDIQGPAVGYGFVDLVAASAGWVRLGVASADAVKFWLNGQIVLDRFVRRRIQEDADLVYVWLRRGRNTLFAKVDSRGEEFRLYVQVYDQLLAPAPDFLDAALAGRAELAKGSYDEAEKRFLAAEVLEPGNPEVALGLAEASLRRKNPAAARGWVSRALLKRPSSADALRMHAEVELALDQPLRAFDALRAAYRAAAFNDSKTFDLWVETAKRFDSRLQEGLALLDQARGLRALKKAPEAAKVLEQAQPLLEPTFMGLADLSVYHREAGDAARAAELGLRAVEKLTPEQLALHTSAEWLLDLVQDLRRTQPQNDAARKRILDLVAQVDPSRSELIRELLALGAKGSGESVVSARVEELLKKRPEKDLYKAYVERLFSAKEYKKVIEIARQGLEAGVVSRTLRIRLAHSHLALGELDEAEEVFKGLLAESDYVERANEGLALVEKARNARQSGGKS
jgi:predicted Zn-dependent protease